MYILMIKQFWSRRKRLHATRHLRDVGSVAGQSRNNGESNRAHTDVTFDN